MKLNDNRLPDRMDDFQPMLVHKPKFERQVPHPLPLSQPQGFDWEAVLVKNIPTYTQRMRAKKSPRSNKLCPIITERIVY